MEDVQMISFALALSLLTGCGGSVAVDEADPFGVAWSAIWIEHKDSEYEEIQVSNVVGLCGKLQAAAEAYNDYEDAFEDAIEDPDSYCEEMEEPTQTYVRATQGLSAVGNKFLSLSPTTEDGDPEVDEDTFEVGDSPGLSGGISYILEDNSTSVLVDWDPDESVDDNCGVDEVDFEDMYDFWVLDEGSELEIANLTDSSFAATLDGDLLDADGDDAGSITGSFSPIYCEIDD